MQVGEWTYFLADDGVHGRELWKTNGTVEGTSLVDDMQPGPQDDAIDDLTAVGDLLFFTATTSAGSQRRLFVITAPDESRQEVRTSASRLNRLFDAQHLTTFNNELYFSAQANSRGRRGLYRVDVTTDGVAATQLLNAADPTDFMVVGDKLFFAADDGQRGRELWQTDGTEEGTNLVLDVFDALAIASAPEQFLEVGNRVYFTAHDDSHGTELWSTDGTFAGTHLVTDLLEGSRSSTPLELTEFGGEVIFSADGLSDRFGRELWITDGTPEGTRSVRRDTTGTFPLDPRSITVTNDAVFFFASSTDRIGTEVWTTDGTHNRTRRLSNLGRAGEAIAPTEELVAAGGSVYFAAADFRNGRELWTSDGTSDGTTIVRDVRSGSASSISADVRIHKLVPHGDLLYFAADSDGNERPEIWITDGTEAGTRVVHDPRGGAVGAFPLDVADGWLYFSSPGPEAQGNELWRTDGTVENTTFVADLTLGQASTVFFPHGEFTPLREGQFLFPAVTRREGTELWVTNGTQAGTYPLDLENGPGSTTFWRSRPGEGYRRSRILYRVRSQQGDWTLEIRRYGRRYGTCAPRGTETLA